MFDETDKQFIFAVCLLQAVESYGTVTAMAYWIRVRLQGTITHTTNVSILAPEITPCQRNIVNLNKCH